MSSQIIIALVCALCAVPFCLIGYLGTISKTPLHFWNGDDKKLKEAIRDVPGYNRRMGAAYRWYGTAFLFCGLVGAFSAPRRHHRDWNFMSPGALAAVEKAPPAPGRIFLNHWHRAKQRCLFSWAKQIGLHNSGKSGIIRKKSGNNY